MRVDIISARRNHTIGRFRAVAPIWSRLLQVSVDARPSRDRVSCIEPTESETVNCGDDFGFLFVLLRVRLPATFSQRTVPTVDIVQKSEVYQIRLQHVCNENNNSAVLFQRPCEENEICSLCAVLIHTRFDASAALFCRVLVVGFTTVNTATST